MVSVNESIGSVLVDAYNWEGNQADFSQRSVGIGRYFRDIEKEHVVVFDLDINIDTERLGNSNGETIKHVVAEAIYNSIKAYRERGETKGVSVKAYIDREGAKIEIEDFAGGIPPEILAYNFASDKTVKRSKERRTGGGIGFRVMRNGARKMGGNLDIYVNDNIGTTVKITVPGSF